MSLAEHRRVDIVPRFVLKDSPACAETDPELFFPQETESWDGKFLSKYIDVAAAKKICSECPLKVDCLEYALVNVEAGIWGGTTEEQRKHMKKKHKIKSIRKSRSRNLW